MVAISPSPTHRQFYHHANSVPYSLARGRYAPRSRLEDKLRFVLNRQVNLVYAETNAILETIDRYFD